MNRNLVVEEAKKHALTNLEEAQKEGGDYWNTITVSGIQYDYNVYDCETNGKSWYLSVYPLERQDETENLYVDTSNPLVEGFPIVPDNGTALDCLCCDVELQEEELRSGESKCFPCLKGNCETCGIEETNENQ